jgi:chitinase
MVLGFDNPRSITEKCNYILEQDLLGGMYWEYTCDNEALELSRTVAGCLLGR